MRNIKSNVLYFDYALYHQPYKIGINYLSVQMYFNISIYGFCLGDVWGQDGDSRISRSMGGGCDRKGTFFHKSQAA